MILNVKMATNNFMSVFANLEKYDGSTDLCTWLQKFNRRCSIAQKMEDDVRGKLIMLCLTGQALAVAEQLEHERNGEQTYEHVRVRLESVFDSSAKREQQMDLFEKRMLLVGESVDQFMLALVQLYKSANPNAVDREFQTAVKRKFLQGLPPKLRQSVYVFVNDPYSQTVNYQRLLEHTRNAEIAFAGEVDDNDATVNVVAGASAAVSLPSNSDVMCAISSLTKTLQDHVDTCSVNTLGGNRSRNNFVSQQFQNNRGRGNNSRYKNRNGSGRNNNNNSNNSNNNNSNNSMSNKPVTICYKCGHPNHLARNCTKN